MSTTAQAAPGGGRYYGPSAFGEDLRRFGNLTLTLARTDFKLRYFGSVLGYFWSLMRPLMLFGVLYVIFSNVIKLGEGVKYYPVILLTSIVWWNFFAEATIAGLTSLVARESIIRKIRFPRLVIPLSSSLTALFNLAMNMLAVFVFVAIAGVDPSWRWVELPLLIGLLFLLATGVGTLLSALFVRYRDVSMIWDVLLQVLFYGSTVLYVAAKFPDSIERYMMFNPVTAILTQMRHALIDPTAPSAADEAHGFVFLLVPVGVVLAICVLGLWVFNRETPRVAENL